LAVRDRGLQYVGYRRQSALLPPPERTSTEVQKGGTLTVGAQQVLDFTIRVGQMSQMVEVTTEAPLLSIWNTGYIYKLSLI